MVELVALVKVGVLGDPGNDDKLGMGFEVISGCLKGSNTVRVADITV
jgi:hypothetical protein